MECGVVTELLGGVDVGTTSVKAVLITAEGTEVAHGRAPTRWTTTAYGTESDPQAIVDTARRALAEALAAVPGARVSSLGLASMAESGVLVGSGDSPVAPVIAWHDSRDTAQLAALESELGGSRFSVRTGLPLWTQWSLTKHRWLVDNAPGVRAATRRYNIAEWVVRNLGGAPATELSLASRTGWLDLAGGAPWEEALDWSGAARYLLGDLVQAGTPLGTVPATDPLPQLRGATLTVAGHDHQAAVVGAGVFGARDELDSCGTAEAIVRTIPAGLPDAALIALTGAGITVGWHVVKDHWCVLGATQGGLVLQKVMAQLGIDRGGLADLDRLAGASVPGASSIALGAEAEDIRISGSQRPGDVWHAATSAVTRQARAISDSISRATGPRGDLVVAGGWSNSAALMRAKAAAFGPLWRTGAREAGARGAALLGGLAHGTYTTYDDLPRPPRTPLDGADSCH